MATSQNSFPKKRVPILGAGILILLAAMWAGLIRLGWSLPPLSPRLPASHGLLMVSGFLGTLISLERAVALRRPWTYVAPIAAAIGGLLVVAGVPSALGPMLILVGSLVLLAVYGTITRAVPALFNVIMAAGGALWAVGNVLWAVGMPVALAALWWQGFLILTIVGERLELSRVLRPPASVQRLLAGTVVVYVAGLVITFAFPDVGTRVVGLGMLALAAWLFRYDVATRTVHQKDLPRFVAVALLSGYVWLAIGGLLALYAGYTSAGFLYDAFLHAVFLGFAFSMIFGHAPIIFPAVLNLPIEYSPRFYAHLILLHLSLLLRIVGDLLVMPVLRLWGGMFNVIALILFLASTAYTIQRVRGRKV